MGDILVFAMCLLIGIFLIAWAISAGRSDPKGNTLPTILAAAGIAVVLGAAFFLADRKMAGAPLSFVDQGKYTVIGTVNDHTSSSSYLILRDNDGRTRLYLLSKEQLKGMPAEGGILEVIEVPSSKKMVFR